MKNTVSVHMLNSFKNLIDLVFDFGLWYVVLSPINSVIKVAVHQFEHQSKSSSRLIVKYLMKPHNMRMRGQPFESLDFSQIFNLLYRVKMVLHAFYGDVFSRFNALAF